MKIFAIKSDSTGEKVLGYLLYYEKADRFYIELPDEADEWDTPLLLSSFVMNTLLCLAYFYVLHRGLRIILLKQGPRLLPESSFFLSPKAHLRCLYLFQVI